MAPLPPRLASSTLGLWTFFASPTTLSNSDTSNPLVAYGLLGIILVAFAWLIIRGHLVPGGEHKRVVDENVELRRQTPDSIAVTVLATDALKENSSILRDVLVLLRVRQEP